MAFTELNLNRLSAELQKLVSAGKKFLDNMDLCADGQIDVSPDDLAAQGREIECQYHVCTSLIRHLKGSIDGNQLFACLGDGERAHLKDLLGQFFDASGAVETLQRSLDRAVYFYKTSRSLGDEADLSEVTEWAKNHRDTVKHVCETGKRLVEILEKAKNQRKRSMMNCVYAPPELMGITPLDTPWIDSDVGPGYPLNYASAVQNETEDPYDGFDRACQTCTVCGCEAEPEAQFCRQCGAPLNGPGFGGVMSCVYASPEVMGKNRKKGFFSALFGRKKREK